MDDLPTTTTRFLSGAAVAASLAASKSAADITSELISSQPVSGARKDKQGMTVKNAMSSYPNVIV